MLVGGGVRHEADGGSREELQEILHATIDVAPDIIGVVLLELGG